MSINLKRKQTIYALSKQQIEENFMSNTKINCGERILNMLNRMTLDWTGQSH